jgi:integrase/recombinase XerD
VKYIVHDQAVLSRPPEGPLAAYIGSFARSLSEQGYSAGSMKQQVRIAAGFSRWLEQTGVGVRSICADHAIRYLRYRARHVRPRRGDQAALRHLIDFLRQEQLIPAERVPLPRLPSTERVPWPQRRSSTTCRSSAVSSKTVSVKDASHSLAYVLAML